MYRVSGPHYVSIYNINGSIVSLFGDIHFSKQEACSKCNNKKDCMTIIQLYDNFMKHKERADIFLEAHYYDKKSSEYRDNLKWYYSKLNKGEGWLRETVNHFKTHMYGKKHKVTNHVHIHYGDLRSHPSLEYFYWIKDVLSSNSLDNVEQSDNDVVVALLGGLKTKHHFKKIADAMVKSNDFEQEMKRVFGENAWLYADETTLTKTSGIHTKIHRVRKQILKLTPKTQKAVLNYHDQQAREILMDYHCCQYAKSRRYLFQKYAKTERFEQSEESLVVTTCIDKWLSHFMELYTLVRMLYTIETGCKNVSSFTGANHAYMLSYFFKNYLTGAEHLWEYNSEKEKTAEKRCVHIPTTIMQHLLTN